MRLAPHGQLGTVVDDEPIRDAFATQGSAAG